MYQKLLRGEIAAISGVQAERAREDGLRTEVFFIGHKQSFCQNKYPRPGPQTRAHSRCYKEFA
ncbi:MAG: hypothetical protein BCS36_09765 [Desulfovibrio sp. MES5]|nr:MAG: hypothetical protein BCS36_09765 [Desulfovibrio sp. MES5]